MGDWAVIIGDDTTDRCTGTHASADSRAPSVGMNGPADIARFVMHAVREFEQHASVAAHPTDLISSNRVASTRGRALTGNPSMTPFHGSVLPAESATTGERFRRPGTVAARHARL